MEQQPHGASRGTHRQRTNPPWTSRRWTWSTLRTVRHPVLAALVADLRERVAAPGSEALWGFDNSM